MGRVSGIVLLTVLSLLIYHFYGFAPNNQTLKNSPNPSDILEVHFIDVGQGDSILIEADHAAMLIDAGNNNKGTFVTDYLASQGITTLDYVIGTHPHSDHIGGMDTVLNSFSVDSVILPSVTRETETFEDVLDAVKEKNLSITEPVTGDQYSLGSAVFTILAPNTSSYEEMNNYSVVTY